MTGIQFEIIKKEIVNGLKKLAVAVDDATDEQMQDLLESPFVQNVEIMFPNGTMADVRKFKLSVRPLPNLQSHTTRHDC
jgi:hypothetical protein